MSQTKSCVSTLVFPTEDGKLVKYLVTSPMDVTVATHAALGGSPVVQGAFALWSDVEYADGTCQRLYRKNRLDDAEELAMTEQPAISVFFNWAGVRNALMFDERVHITVRMNLRQRYYAYLESRLDRIRSSERRTRDEMLHGNAVFTYLQAFKFGDHHCLPELPDVDLGFANSGSHGLIC